MTDVPGPPPEEPFTASDEPGDSERERGTGKSEAVKRAGLATLTFGALGVVFGDIGTSPLYALKTVFADYDRAVKPTEASVYGVISLIFWAIVVIVCIKTITLIMRANNQGEGGIMALISLVERVSGKGTRWTALLVGLGIFGAALFYGDGMITPAISVLSAVEGMEVVSPSFEDFTVPVAVAIILLLFGAQRFGTGLVGRLFGPVMLIWFVAIAVVGIGRIVDHPEIFKALSPHYGVVFFLDNGLTAFLALGGVVLAVTGAEALYADMGHFGRKPISRAWFFLVFPALTLNYMGQGSLVLSEPSAIENPFFLLVPDWARIPMVLLATMAAVIASQAVISGAFSVTKQAVQLGFLPRLSIKHTSREEVGQIYAPGVNWGLCVAVIALIVGFGSSAALAAAYGIAVTGTLAIDTVLFFVVVRLLWKKPVWMVAAGMAAFLLVDLSFFAANLPKVVHGGWFPLVIAAVVFTILTTWRKGRAVVTRLRGEKEGPLRDFIESLRTLDPPVFRTPGTGVFLNANTETTPIAMRANVEHNHALHESVVIVSLDTERVPHVPPSERVSVDDLGYRDDGIIHI
nr:KUP/HAK/KT family potassium transporter [Thermoleophilaceae bacterium]